MNPGRVSALAPFPSGRRPIPASVRSEDSPPGPIACMSSYSVAYTISVEHWLQVGPVLDTVEDLQDDCGHASSLSQQRCYHWGSLPIWTLRNRCLVEGGQILTTSVNANIIEALPKIWGTLSGC